MPNNKKKTTDLPLSTSSTPMNVQHIIKIYHTDVCFAHKNKCRIDSQTLPLCFPWTFSQH